MTLGPRLPAVSFRRTPGADSGLLKAAVAPTAASAAPVVVVGGGFAGLAAATMLAEAGVAVHVIEARPTLGGRANTFRDPTTGEAIDNGQHVLAGCYHETLRFLCRIDASDLLHRPSALCVPMVDEEGRWTELRLPPLPAPLNLLAGVLAWDALSGEDRRSLLRLRAAIDPSAASSRETVLEWLHRHGQSPRLCRLLWEPLALAALNQPIEHANAAAFVAVTARMFAPPADNATLLLPAVPLDELYVRPSERLLTQAGGRITTHSRAHLLLDNGRVTGVWLRGEIVTARAVISAVPWFALADLFPSPPSEMSELLESASQMSSMPIVTVNLWTEHRLNELPPLFGLPGRVFQWIFDRRQFVRSEQMRSNPEASRGHLSLVSSGIHEVCGGTNQAIIDTATRELFAAVPSLRRAPLRHAGVVRERRATFSLRPGQPDRPVTRTALRNLYLAGDWTDTALPATIEGAVLSGHRAAQAVLDSVRKG